MINFLLIKKGLNVKIFGLPLFDMVLFNKTFFNTTLSLIFLKMSSHASLGILSTVSSFGNGLSFLNKFERGAIHIGKWFIRKDLENTSDFVDHSLGNVDYLTRLEKLNTNQFFYDYGLPLITSFQAFLERCNSLHLIKSLN